MAEGFRLPTVSEPQAYAVHAFHTTRVAAAEHLEPGDGEAVLAAAAAVHELAGAALDAFGSVACERGCHHCCHITVAASPPEVFLVAARLREELDPLARFGARAALAVDEQFDTRDRFAHGKACAFLTDGLCSIYPVRPLSCRGLHSLDVATCERALLKRDPDARIPSIPGRMTTSAAITFALCTAADDAGLDGRPLRLVAATRAALDDPGWLDRWLTGERIADALIDDEGSAEWAANDYGPLAMSQDIITRFGALT
jgi:hypothetical protein